jgi:hypothetical protein
LCEPITSRSVADELLDGIARRGLGFQAAQGGEPLAGLLHVFLVLPLDIRYIADIERRPDSLECRQFIVELDGQPPGQRERLCALGRPVVGDADPPHGGARGVSSRRDRNCRRWVLEQLAGVIADEVASELVVVARAYHEQVGMPGRRELV